jgi:MFS family permease
VLPVLELIAFGGAVVMTLPYAVLIPLMPTHSHGALTGFYSLSRGIGTMLGPVLVGLAIELFRKPLAGTHGYAAMWGVAGNAVLLSTCFLRRLRLQSDDRRELRTAAQSGRCTTAES